MSGWVRIERDIWKHPFFDNEPMSKREAWIWMISRAAWKDTRHKVGAQMRPVPRGSFMTTLRELQSKFKWRSDKKVRDFLKQLEVEGMVERTVVGSKNAPKTHVTISNYDKYQSQELNQDAPKTRRARRENAVKKQDNKRQEAEASGGAGAVAILSSLVGEAVAMEFVAHRLDMRKPLTERGAAAMFKKLESHHDPRSVLLDSIANGWQGVFPEKIKPKLKTIDGGNNERVNRNQQLQSAALANEILDAARTN